MSELSAQLAAALPENSAVRPEWLKALRERAAEQFRTHGLPTRKDESWKYTGLSTLDQTGVQLASPAGLTASGVTHPPPLAESGLQLKLLDGQFLEQVGDTPSGVTVLPLAAALDDGVNGLQTLLESLAGRQPDLTSGHGFSALNSATLDSGVVIHVAAGKDAGRLALTWSSSQGEQPLLFNSRICVIVEAGARLELLEHFESAVENANTSNIILQAQLAEDSVLEHIRFQQETETATLITRTEVSQQTNSEYAYYGFDLGGGLVRHDLHASLLGKDAKSGINGALANQGGCICPRIYY